MRNDHNHEHQAYIITDNVFVGFVKNNQKWLDEMIDETIINIVQASKQKDNDICSIDIMKHPWCVRYIGKISSAEGLHIIFLDENMNKLYSYYDVE